MKYWKKLCLIGIAAALAGCGQNEDVIRIGAAGVFSGPDGQFGTKMIEGTKVALEEWNAKGGVLGKPIVLIERDDEGKPNQAVSVAHELASKNVHAVIGHFNSGCTIPTSSIYAQNGILQITPASTSPQVTERGISTIFRVCGRDDQQGIVSAEFAVNKLGLKKIAVLHNKTAYGQGIAEEFQKRFTELGGEVTSFTGIAEEELDFRANISAIKEEDAEGVFFGVMYAQGGPFFNQLRQAGLDIPFLAGDGVFEREFLNTVGTEAKGAYLTFGPDYKNLPSAQSFLKKYRELYGEEGPYSIYGYEALNVLLQAMQTAGTTQADKVAEALRAGVFDTTLGAMEFDEHGDLKKANYVIWTTQNGEFVVAE